MPRLVVQGAQLGHRQSALLVVVLMVLVVLMALMVLDEWQEEDIEEARG